MIEYKVGERLFVCISKYWSPPRTGYAVIEKVGRKYAGVSINGCKYKIDINSGDVFHANYSSDSKTIMGAVYESEFEYAEKCAIEKYAAHIKRSVGIIGYRGFLNCSMEELKKIASILKINLD